MENIKTENRKIQWRVLEFKHTEKSVDWFWAVGIITLIFAIIAIAILENLLFAILILIGTFALVTQSIKKPREISCSIGNEGIMMGSVLYKYSSLESFWVIEDEKKIILKSKKMAMPYIIIPLGDNLSTKNIQVLLSEHLKEEEMSEPLSQKIFEKLGF